MPSTRSPGASSKSRTFELQRAILMERNGYPRSGSRVLDFGCGSGALVAEWRRRGFDAFGCDIELPVDNPYDLAADILRPIDTSAYRLPFDDDSFELVFSMQVFEHLVDHDVALKEIRRVLTRTGCCLHIFPSRWRLIEPHTHVPLGGVISGRAWIGAWVRLGVRGGRHAARFSVRDGRFFAQRPLPAAADQAAVDRAAVVASMHRFLKQNTNYISGRAMERAFRRHFETVESCESDYLRFSPSSRARATRMLPVPAVTSWLCRSYWARAIFAKTPRAQASTTVGR